MYIYPIIFSLKNIGKQINFLIKVTEENLKKFVHKQFIDEKILKGLC